jgi:hypothetical protein
MKTLRSLVLLSLILLTESNAFAQQTGSIDGRVVDSLGGAVVGATVILVAPGGKEKTVVTNRDGEFLIKGLAPGKYIVRVIAPQFGLYEKPDVAVKAGERQNLSMALSIESIKEQVDVSSGIQVSTDPDANQNAVVLKEQDLADLPDDPNEIAAYLQALAGPTAGPDGAQILIDGISGGSIPSKDAIAEIRINQNPFSAEFDRVGFGRIEIITKPGFDKLSGSLNINFNDAILNSRNPFASNRAASRTRNISGFLSGPVRSKRSSFFVDISRSQIDANSVVSATILDTSLNVGSFNQDITVPTSRFAIGARLDHQLSDANTLSGRYNFSLFTSKNQGAGGFSLPSRAYNSEETNHEINLVASMIVNPKTINESRFQYELSHSEQFGDNSDPSIDVVGAFAGGGAQVGSSFNKLKRWEFQNYTTTSYGADLQHIVKFGVRLRGIRIESRQELNYVGTFTFTGFPGVSSIEHYRQKVLGNPDPRYDPTQFSLTAGNSLASVTQTDYSLFFTDHWKARKDLAVNFGLRYENQDNINDNSNFAPRMGLAWAPGAGGNKPPKTVLTAGAGLFYERFSESNTLRARRNDGVSQLQYIVTDPAILRQPVFTINGVTNVPTAGELSSYAPRSNIPFTIGDDIRSPYSFQSALGVEHQLPYKTTVSATFILAKSWHTLRQRNINAPVCPTIQACPSTLTSTQIEDLRPDRSQGNIYQLEPTGYSNTMQLLVRFDSRLHRRLSISGSYTAGIAKGDTDSLSSPRIAVNSVGFPAYSYDLANEYAESVFVPRHMLFLRSSLTLPWNINAFPVIMASSGRLFNITSGEDSNHDSLFFERPTYSTLYERCRGLELTASFCGLSGISNRDTTVIPRNYGKGPGTFLVNLNFSKMFSFGGSTNSNGGNGGSASGGSARKPYILNVGLNIKNLLNNVNLNPPVGSLTSPSFGRSTTSGGIFGFFGGGSENRRIDLSLRFNW